MTDHYASRENLIALLSRVIGQALSASPAVAGREVHFPLEALLAIRRHLHDDHTPETDEFERSMALLLASWAGKL